MPVLNRIVAFQDEMTAWRRHLHAHPELGFCPRRPLGLFSMPKDRAMAAVDNFKIARHDAQGRHAGRVVAADRGCLAEALPAQIGQRTTCCRVGRWMRKEEKGVRSKPSDQGVTAERDGARERILSAAYDLFSRQGIAAIGVDAIIARAGVARMSLYRHFGSKEGLIVAFLERRNELCGARWLETEIARRASEPVARLLAILDVFHDWFQQPAFEGCSFINVLIEAPRESTVGQAAALQLAAVRTVIAKLAHEAALEDVDRFAQAWHILMKGSIIAAAEGQREAARIARDMGRLILAQWPRRTEQAGAGTGCATQE
jgi:AcrR family transcriptional regulator